MANKPKAPMTVAEMSKKTFKRLCSLAVVGIITEAIIATSNNNTPWIINVLQTYFPNLMQAIF